eukprot:1884934-Heterocapsa_arctica.AAC.1
MLFLALAAAPELALPAVGLTPCLPREPFLGGPVVELVVRKVPVHVVVEVSNPRFFSLLRRPACRACRAAGCVLGVVVFAGAVLIVGL